MSVRSIDGDSLTQTRNCQRAGCDQEGTDPFGRWRYCHRHAQELKENRRARQATKGPIPKLSRPGPYETRALTLVETARKLDYARYAQMVTKIESEDAANEWRRRVRALACAEGLSS